MKKDFIWNTLGTTAWSFLSLFLLIIVTRINGVFDSGLFSFAFSFAVIMFAIGCYGGRTYQVSDHKNDFSTSNYVSLRIITSFCTLVIALGFILINGYDFHKAALLLTLVGYRVFDAIADVFYGILQKKHRLYISGKSLFFKSIVSFIVFLVIDLLTHNLLLSTLSLPIISFLFIALYDIPQSRRIDDYTIKFETVKLKLILKSTFLPFSTTILSLVFVNVARYFIDIFHPNLQGYFGIIVMPLSLIVLLFSFISTPTILYLSDKYNKGQFSSLRQYITQISSLMVILTFVICVAVYFLGIPILNTLFGLDFSAYIQDIILILLTGLMISITSLFTNVAVIARKLRSIAIIYLSSNVILIGLCLILVSSHDIRGAVMSYIIASTIQCIVAGTYYYKITNYKDSKNL